MAQTQNLVVIGSANVDIVAFVDEIPRPGETKTGVRHSQNFGGKGANQAVMAARFGVPVKMIAGLGNDANGQATVANFSSNNVDTSHLFILDDSTGTAHIWVEETGENRIILIPGANHLLSKASVLDEFEKITNVGMVLAQCEIPIEITNAVFSAAKKRNIVTMLNPAPFRHLSNELLENTDWLVVNEIEFMELHPDKKYPQTDEDLLSLPRRGNLVVTLGSQGAALVTKEDQVTRLAAPKINAVDTTGAGDCLIGSFAGALLTKVDVVDALKIAITCASESVTRSGAQSSYPSKDWVKKLLP